MLTLANNVYTRRSTPYAVKADFCRVFAEDMSGLYLLSLLLTADREKAEQCFVSGFGESVKANRVFKDWARSWARRTIILNAVRAIKPTPGRAQEKPSLRAIHSAPEAKSESEALLGKALLNAVLSLGTFERFVFVMSVLEHYSDQDCAILLECSRRDVALARAQAVEHVASFANPRLPVAASGTGAFAQERLLPVTA
jgi:hypothetical protein